MFNDKIEIDIEDKIMFGQIALVIDKPRLLEAIKKIRLRFKVKAPLLSSSEHIEFLRNLGNQGNDGKFHKSIRAILNRHNLDPVYSRILQKVILFNRIEETDYIDAYVVPTEIISREYKGYYAIVITPNTSKHSLIKVFDEFKDSVRISRKGSGYRKYDYLSELVKENTVIRTEIKRDRDWYWSHKMGSSYNTLAKLEKNIPQNTIVQAIKRYRKSLADN